MIGPGGFFVNHNLPWELVAIYPAPGSELTKAGHYPWSSFVLRHKSGFVAKVCLFKSRKRLWTWQWEESFLGYTTVIEAAASFRHRSDAIEHLCRAIDALEWGELAERVRSWE